MPNTSIENTPKYSEITQPASHGFVIDTELGKRRSHVRIFDFVVAEFQGGRVELPVVLGPREACDRLQEALDALRRHADQMDAYAGKKVPDADIPLAGAPAALEKPKPFQNRLMPPAPRKVLGLDIDGILNPTPEQQGSIMPVQLELLKWIVAETGCLILVISTWRTVDHQMAKLSKVLNDMGCQWELAPLAFESKSEALCDWLACRDVVKLCVLDDEPVRGFDFCQVSPPSELGLTHSAAAAVIQMLNNP